MDLFLHSASICGAPVTDRKMVFVLEKPVSGCREGGGRRRTVIQHDIYRSKKRHEVPQKFREEPKSHPGME